MIIMKNKTTRKEISHDRIVSVAARAIRRAGTQGVGVADMMKEAGLTHGGFYAHFDSRDALVVEAMQRAWSESSTALKEAIDRRVANGECPLKSLVESYLHESNIERIECGCLVAALASEIPRLEDSVLEEARLHTIGLINLVKNMMPGGANPALAEVLTSTMVGALQLARIFGNQQGRDLLARSREEIIKQFKPVFFN